MKTTKFFLIVALLSFGAMVFSQNALNPRICRISLEDAMQNKTICKAMYKQLNMDDVLNTDHPGYYTALVKVNKQVYLVYGKYSEWYKFFRVLKIITPKTKL